MTDIVERLRRQEHKTPQDAMTSYDAADEIERLRKAMQDAIKEANQPSYGDPFDALDYCYDAISILKNALEGK